MKPLDFIIPEVREWSRANFGNQETNCVVVAVRSHTLPFPLVVEPDGVAFLNELAPLMGLVEEYGEMLEAISARDNPEIFDAAGDILVYLCDFCGRSKAEINYTPVGEYAFALSEPTAIGIAIGKLFHHVLKRCQKIRGYEDDAFYVIQRNAAVSSIWAEMDRWISFQTEVFGSGSALSVLNTVWDRVVSKRDWKANATTGKKAILES